MRPHEQPIDPREHVALGAIAALEGGSTVASRESGERRGEGHTTPTSDPESMGWVPGPAADAPCSSDPAVEFAEELPGRRGADEWT